MPRSVMLHDARRRDLAAAPQCHGLASTMFCMGVCTTSPMVSRFLFRFCAVCVSVCLLPCRESEVASRETAAAAVVATAEERRREAEAWESRMRKVGAAGSCVVQCLCFARSEKPS